MPANVQTKKLAKIQEEAKGRHTHIVIFKSDSEEEDVAVMARVGLTTKAIADATGLSESQAQYRVMKAQKKVGTRFRAEFRNGSPLAMKAVAYVAPEVRAEIQRKVTPHFLPLASSRVNQ